MEEITQHQLKLKNTSFTWGRLGWGLSYFAVSVTQSLKSMWIQGNLKTIKLFWREMCSPVSGNLVTLEGHVFSQQGHDQEHSILVVLFGTFLFKLWLASSYFHDRCEWYFLNMGTKNGFIFFCTLINKNFIISKPLKCIEKVYTVYKNKTLTIPS